MPYKKNRLRLKRERISADCSRRGKYGNEVKAEKRMAEAEESVVVATVRTSGSLGEHCIELLSCGDPLRVYVRLDGELRRPRTAQGFVRLLGQWLWHAG
jgi:hypothetical protein